MPTQLHGVVATIRKCGDFGERRERKSRKVRTMSIWGKLAGAAAGLAVGGPIGALAGGLAGHFIVDRDSDAPAEKQVAFTIGVIALGAKMAKSDGRVTVDEVHAFKRVFKVPGEDEKNVARVFDLAKQDVAGFEAYAKQLAGLFKDDPGMLHNVLEGLFHIAEADGTLPQAEQDYLAAVAKHFGIPNAEFRYILARHTPPEQRNPYDVLGITPAATDDVLRAHYHKLMQDNHPDKLVARGMPQEMINIATKKVAAINEAYAEIRKERGL
jgi:DnaJ like chaperone protein